MRPPQLAASKNFTSFFGNPTARSGFSTASRNGPGRSVCRLAGAAPDGPMARLLKFLILFVAGVAILHKLQPYGLALF